MSTLLIPKPTATAVVAGHSVGIRTGSTLTLDETQEYVTADLALPLLEPDQVEDIDPRDGVRAVVTAAIGDGDPLVADLGVRKRTVDHKAKTIRLVCASDEALLGDYAPLADDLTPRVHEASVREVIDYVLGVAIPGAALESAPSDDADVTAYWSVTNLFLDPSCESAAPLWIPDVANPTITRQSADGIIPTPVMFGTYCVRVAATATGGLAIAQDGRASASPGKPYTASVYLQSHGTSLKDARLILRWIGPAGNIIGDARSSYVTTTTAWARRTFTATAPKGTAAVRFYIEWAGPHAVGNLHYLDGVMVHEGAEPVPFYTGSTAATTHYTYAWAGTVDASQSTRTPVLERLPESLTWRAGQSAWEFLLALTASVGLRLFCDGARKWRLVPTTYTVPGVVVASPLNSREGTDTISRDGDLWADGVVVRYVWDDDDGTSHEQFDTAGTGGKVITREFKSPYPGPGAAAFILNRLKGQGRAQEAVAATTYTAAPAMEAVVTLPGTVDQIGRLTRVQFGLTEGFMILGTRGLTDAPPEAWIQLLPGESWDDSPIGASWIGEVI